MLTAENILEFTWKKAFPSSESLETIERVIRVLDYREEEGLNALYRHALDEAEAEGEGDEFPDMLRWLALQRAIDFVEYGDVAFGDLRPFEVFTHVQTLHMPVTLGSDLAPLGKLTQLRSLSVVGAQDGDYGFLRSLPELKSLHVSGHGSRGLEVCSGLLHLKKLSLKGISIDLDQIIHEGIEELTLDGCGVTSLDALGRLKNLRFLWIPNNRVEDLSPLAGRRELSFLMCDDNCIKDFSVLDTLPGLTPQNKASVRKSQQSGLGTTT